MLTYYVYAPLVRPFLPSAASLDRDRKRVLIRATSSSVFAHSEIKQRHETVDSKQLQLRLPLLRLDEVVRLQLRPPGEVEPLQGALVTLTQQVSKDPFTAHAAAEF